MTRAMLPWSRDLGFCRIRSEVTLRAKGGTVSHEDWRRILGGWLPRPERYGGHLKNGHGNERQMEFSDPRDAITYAVAVRRQAQAVRNPQEGIEICIVVDVGEVIGA